MRLLILAVVFASGCAGVPSTPPASAPPPPTEIEVGPLEPGRYTYSGFEPSIVVEVGDGWEGAHRLAEFWDVVRGELTALTSVQFSRPTVIYGPAFGIETDVAADAIAAWPENGGLVVSEPRPATVDGLVGTEIDLANESGSSVNVWGSEDGNLGIPPATTLRVVVIETDDGLLLVSRQGPSESFADVLAITEPVVASIRIGD